MRTNDYILRFTGAQEQPDGYLFAIQITATDQSAAYQYAHEEYPDFSLTEPPILVEPTMYPQERLS